ncbi:unnamed protein product [Alopecurus aequalis]
MPWLLLLCLAAVSTDGVLGAVVQPDLGFISIDCGLVGETGYMDSKTTLHYITDDSFIDAGVKSNLSLKYNDESVANYWNTVRSFPDGTRNCYTIGSLQSGLKYLIRSKFAYRNYDTLNKLPIFFDLYIGVNFWMTMNILNNYAYYAEAIVVVPDNFLQVCLVNTGLGTPFINALELRPLKNNLYPQANETHGLVLVQRLNLGPSDPNTIFRYPADPHDRCWFTLVNATADWAENSTELEVKNDDDPYATPNAVMQTAITTGNGNSNIEFSLDLPTPLNHTSRTWRSYIYILHFSELILLPGNASRQYDIQVNGQTVLQAFKPQYLKSRSVMNTLTFYDPYFDSTNSTEKSQFSFSINALANSTLPPIINAIELFSVIFTTNLGTDAQDVSAIVEIKKYYQVLNYWMGDPCIPSGQAWAGLNCSYDDSMYPTIRSVDLSSSHLDGGISPSFANLTSLQYLDLSNNFLTGSIPDELSQLPLLMLIDVSNNQLDGSIPFGIVKKIQDGSMVVRYGGNPNLYCSSSCEPATQGRTKRAIIMVALVIVITGIILSVALLLYYLRRRKKQGSIPNSSKMKNNEIASSISNNDKYTNCSLQLENRRFTYKELEMITKNFRQVLGQGGFGCVYHGFLENGIQVAVKLRSHSSDQGVKEFLVEAQVLTRIHHKNLVTMIGYCKEGEHMALVYEYMPEGNLQEHIAGKDIYRVCLTWRQRLRIALESSQGLEYLHKSCNPPLIHRDVKATNILLNTALDAKIADFGLSKAFSVNNNAYTSTVTLVGTPGYVDPEYQATMQPSTSSDVYSFGVVLLELITGKLAIVRDPEPITVIRWVQRRLSRGDIEAVVDARMQADYNINSVWKAAEIALKCTKQDSLHRPTMTEVVVHLQECLQLEEDCIGVETTNELYNLSNTSFEMDQQKFQRAPTMDDGPAAR